MKPIKKYSIVWMLIFLLAGCSYLSPKGPSEETLSIKPYTLSDHEGVLLTMAGAEIPEIFTVDGKIAEGEDLKYSVEVYHDGKFKEELLLTSSTIDKQFKGDLIAFNVAEIDEKQAKITLSYPSGSTSTTYPIEVASLARSFGSLVESDSTLIKDKPSYLAAWVGTKGSMLRGVVPSDNGGLPNALETYDIALLYKVVWTDAGRD
ncbi:hypothetical protein QWT69_11370 [Sporosarcina oncorhynchi]|uniref:Lipoprotein n=1 Tax=Sporosarcina oncorhynchi TaxID=3056444 RepID=A0ABZ0L2V5_9BACL|nr:hypothetical protein [Sporosarcina sp. T2O-4]WOV86510.1 hypothetical protein QWT69_11370 [Sporosarcina sp. T2O-4]